MYRVARKPGKRMRGVTLIELMIVVVVIGILATIAYPSFMEQVRKSRRADGKSALLETSQRLERCYTRFSRYDNAGCAAFSALPENSQEGYYAVSAAAITATTYTLDATPQGDQVNDSKCGALRLTSSGQQGSQGLATDANNCW